MTIGLETSAAAFIAVVGATGALGTAAFGLVDASKAVYGGIANIGFGHLRNALAPFDTALASAVGSDWRRTILAHWRNGKPKAEQKAIAVALIQLGLTAETAAALAPLGHVDPVRFAQAAGKLVQGDELGAAEVNIISRFRTSVEAKLDAAFERAEQQYRNVARFIAGTVATVLSAVGGWLIFAPADADYLGSNEFWRAILVGLVAVPIAPLTKDLVSSLSAAVRAAKLARSL